MPAAERQAILAYLAAKLLHLYVLRAEACGQEDWHRLRALEAEIERAKSNRSSMVFKAPRQPASTKPVPSFG